MNFITVAFQTAQKFFTGAIMSDAFDPTICGSEASQKMFKTWLKKEDKAQAARATLTHLILERKARLQS